MAGTVSRCSLTDLEILVDEMQRHVDGDERPRAAYARTTVHH